MEKESRAAPHQPVARARPTRETGFRRVSTRVIRGWIPATLLLSLTSVVLLSARPTAAFPGVFVGKDETPRYNHATQVVLYQREDLSAVTVMPDYQGPLVPFAWLLPVPDDVKLGEVQTLRRDILEHLDQVSAPRFAEFWEMDPCEPGAAEQDWERNLKVEGPGFLGSGMPQFDKNKKVPPELLVNLDPEFRDSNYTTMLLPRASAATTLSGKGYRIGADLASELAAGGGQLLVIEVDPNKIELSGANRAILSPVRFLTRTGFKLESRLGLHNMKEHQELLVYVIASGARYQAKNYANVFPPTNLHVDFKVKERMGEFYAGLADAVREKHPGAFFNEYAWSTKGCGQPCANAPLSLAEVLTLGADEYERTVPEEARLPEPPPLTDEEKEAQKKAKPAEKKEMEAQREEVARRKALIERHQDYVLSRLRYRYDRAGMKADVELAAADPVEGGVALPKGPQGEASTAVSPAKENQLQTRFNHLHPNIAVVKCDNPEPHRWGKAPRTYRGNRKIWLAQDLAYKDRKMFKLPEVVKTAVAELGLPGVALEVSGTAGPASGAAGAAGGEPAKPDGNCKCSLIGRGTSGVELFALTSWLAAFGLLRRRGRVRG